MKHESKKSKINDVEIWYKNDIRHRVDGPAVIEADGRAFWYVNDKLFTESQSFCEEAGMSGEEVCIFIIKHGYELRTHVDEHGVLS